MQVVFATQMLKFQASKRVGVDIGHQYPLSQLVCIKPFTILEAELFHACILGTGFHRVVLYHI